MPHSDGEAERSSAGGGGGGVKAAGAIAAGIVSRHCLDKSLSQRKFTVAAGVDGVRLSKPSRLVMFAGLVVLLAIGGSMPAHAAASPKLSCTSGTLAAAQQTIFKATGLVTETGSKAGYLTETKYSMRTSKVG